MAIIEGTNGNDILTGSGENTIQRVSTTSSGGQADGGSDQGEFSPDGTEIVFASDAANLVAGDTNGAMDIFIKNLATGAVRLVSANSTGTEGDDSSFAPVFSSDGTKIAFQSAANNLVPGDTNGVPDIFVKDMVTGAVTRISADLGGIQGDGQSLAPVFSPDGTKVAFGSEAANLVLNDTNGVADIFIKDLVTGAVTLVSTDSAGGQAKNGGSGNPVFSPDGTKIAFESSADNLVPGDIHGGTNVFVKDLATGAVTLVSKDIVGPLTDSTSGGAAFSPDGTKIAFSANAEDHTPDGFEGFSDIFIKDLITGAVSDPIGRNDFNLAPQFSPDGTKIAFVSGLNELAEGNVRNILIEDLATGAVSKVSGDNAGFSGDGDSVHPVFSPDGGKILFASDASSLAPGDTNGARDVFLTTLAAGAADAIFGNLGNDLIHSGGGNDTVDGNSGDDRIFGDAGNDLLAGGPGNDDIDGGIGNDTVSANSGDDIVSGGAGDDRLFGNNGNDTVFGRDGNDVMSGGDGSDTLFGDAGNDTISGDSARDAIYGGAGADAMDGGSGTDSLHYDTDFSGVNVNLGTNTAAGGEAEGDTIRRFENLYGGSHGDTLTGSDGKNTIVGNGGDDTISGGGGSDLLVGDGAVYHNFSSSNVVFPHVQDGVDISHVVNGTAALGIVPGDLSTAPATTAVITFDRAEAGGANTIGSFEAGADGVIKNVAIDFTNALQAHADDTTAVNLDADNHLGLFVINDGFSANNGYQDIDLNAGTLHFYFDYGQADQRLANIHDAGGRVSLVFTDNLNQDTILQGPTFFTTERGGSAAINPDNEVHVVSGLVSASDTQDLRIGFEDFLNKGDSDYNDVVVDVSMKPVFTTFDFGNDILNGGVGQDRLVGGAGADTFVFDHSALSGSDTIGDLSVAQGDRIELHDLLTGYDPSTSVITDFVKITDSGSDSKVFVDANGAAGGQHFVQIAQISGVTGLADVAQLLTDHVLLVA